MSDKIQKLVEELIKAGFDFTLDNEQSEVRIYLEDYSLVLSVNGKWRLE